MIGIPNAYLVHEKAYTGKSSRATDCDCFLVYLNHSLISIPRTESPQNNGNNNKLRDLKSFIGTKHGGILSARSSTLSASTLHLPGQQTL